MASVEAFDAPNCAELQFEGTFNKDRIVVFLYTPLEKGQLKSSGQGEIE